MKAIKNILSICSVALLLGSCQADLLETLWKCGSRQYVDFRKLCRQRSYSYLLYFTQKLCRLGLVSNGLFRCVYRLS